MVPAGESNFGHVQDNDGRDKANTETSNETARDKEAVRTRCRLKNDTNDEDDATQDNGRSTSDEVVL